MLIKKLILLIAVCAGLQSTAQVVDITSFFKASESQGKVLLSWQINAGSTCNGIQIYRGTDSTSLKQVGEIIGVCGSITEPVDYSFTDDQLNGNGTYYYRLEFGTQGFSEIISIAIEGLFEGTSQVRPNPIETTGRIFFKAPASQSYTLKLYNTFGQEVLQKTTSTNSFDVNALDLKSGVYHYSILINEDVVVAQEKLIIK